MDSYKLKLKLGVHEFEAEGSPEIVERQLQIFKELVLNAPAVQPAAATTAATMDDSKQTVVNQAATNGNNESVDAMISKIMKVEDRIVSLTVRARGDEDAILLLVYGQKVLRSNDAITGFEIGSGLDVSGQRINRPDRILDRMAKEGTVIATGAKRGKKYRITNQGLRNARSLAADLIQTIA